MAGANSDRHAAFLHLTSHPQYPLKRSL